MDILDYLDYIKNTDLENNSLETYNYSIPSNPTLTHPDDKIANYMKSQFISMIPYYSVGISSVNIDLAKYNHNK